MKNPLLILKRQEFEALHKKRDELLAKEQMTDEETLSLKDINDKCAGLIEQIKALQDAANDHETHNALLNSPMLKLHTGNPDGEGEPEKKDGVEHLGFQKAGHVVLDQKTRQVLYEEGAGCWDEKKWGALFETDYKSAWLKLVQAKGDVHRLSGPEVKALEEGLDPQGGYLVPPEVLARLLSKRPAPTRLAGRVTDIVTGRDKVMMPKVKYATDDIFTTPFRVTWTGENPASDTAHRVDDADLFGQIEIPVYTAMMSGVLTNDLIEDSVVNALNWMGDKLAETEMLTRDQMILTGSGVGQPLGIITNPGGVGQPAVIQSGVANDINADAIRGFPFNLPEQYLPDAVWVFNRASTGKKIALLADANGRYLFTRGIATDGLVNGFEERLDGYPIVYSAFADDIGDGKHPIVFGDLGGYFMARRVGLSIQFLRERYAERNQVGIVARVRYGGKVAEEWRMKILKSDNA